MANEMNLERQHYLISPTDEAQRVVTEKIEKACRNKLVGDYKIRLNPGYTTTITCVYVESLIRVLIKVMRENRGDGSINFLDLFTVSSSNRENDEADKDGNINVKFTPGSLCAAIMDRDYCPVIEPKMWQDTIITMVEKECSHILATKHKMTSSSVQNYTKIAFCYIEFFFRTLKLMAKVARDNGNFAAMINFLEMFEAHATIESQENPENPELEHEVITVKLRPGFQAKLLIKDDGITESSEEEDDV